MSLKQMTTKQLRDDLEILTLMWPDGIPPEQVDRMKAIKTELARRPDAEDVATQPTSRQPPAPVGSLGTDVLEMELRALSAALTRNPGDDQAQGRFADVRFELRRRSRVDAAFPNGERPQEAPPIKVARSPVTARDIEMPPELVAKPSLARSLADAATNDGRVASKRLMVDEVTPVMRKRAERTVAKQVKGYSAQVDGDTVFLRHKTHVDDTIAQTVTGMTVEDAREFTLMWINATEIAEKRRADDDNG